jgi:hypothetical protein
MIVVLLMRDGSNHIVNYKMHHGFRTFCYKTIKNNNQINTFSADNTFPGLCRTCKEAFDSMYQDDLDYDPSTARNQFYDKFVDLLTFHRYEYLGPKPKFDPNFRASKKLEKYQRILKNKKNKK